jgi:hypothetical protein
VVLTRILCHLARRRILPLELRNPESGRLLMVRHASTFRGAIDLAFNQLRPYGRGEMAWRAGMFVATMGPQGEDLRAIGDTGPVGSDTRVSLPRIDVEHRGRLRPASERVG